MALNLPTVDADLPPRAHAIMAYEENEERDRALAAFLDDGRVADETMVFIHAFDSNEKALEHVIALRPKARGWVGDRLFLIRLHAEAFERGGKIDREHVEAQLTEVEELTRDSGRDGARLFVDASHRYFAEGRAEEWFDFEAWLGPRLRHEVALVCAYRWEDLRDPDRLACALATHSYRYSP